MQVAARLSHEEKLRDWSRTFVKYKLESFCLLSLLLSPIRNREEKLRSGDLTHRIEL